MRRRRNDFGRAESRWARKDIFSERRRRVPWKTLAILAVLSVGGYLLADPAQRARLEGLWAEVSKRVSGPAPTGAPAAPGAGAADRDQLILPLPPPRSN